MREGEEWPMGVGGGGAAGQGRGPPPGCSRSRSWTTSRMQPMLQAWAGQLWAQTYDRQQAASGTRQQLRLYAARSDGLRENLDLSVKIYLH